MADSPKLKLNTSQKKQEVDKTSEQKSPIIDLKLSIPDKMNIEVSTKDQKSNRKSIDKSERKVLIDKEGHETLLALDMSVVKK